MVRALLVKPSPVRCMRMSRSGAGTHSSHLVLSIAPLTCHLPRCDRILWCPIAGSEDCIALQGMAQDSSLTTSDHKPVYARFRVAIPPLMSERPGFQHVRCQPLDGGGSLCLSPKRTPVPKRIAALGC
eukprot:COSAG01_NODE_8424_length_2788_cov_1.386017_4_plen_128_part_00